MRLCEVTKLTVQGFVNGLVAKWEPSTVIRLHRERLTAAAAEVIDKILKSDFRRDDTHIFTTKGKD